MSCRCVLEQWQRDRERQRKLAKITARMSGRAQALYRDRQGRYRFTGEEEAVDGEIEEIITPY